MPDMPDIPPMPFMAWLEAPVIISTTPIAMLTLVETIFHTPQIVIVNRPVT
jgi:hypothetical protein